MKAASTEWYTTSARRDLPTTLSSSRRLFDTRGKYASFSSSSSNNTFTRPAFLSSSSQSRSTGNTTSSSSYLSKRSRSRSTSTSTTEPTTSTFTNSDASKYKEFSTISQKSHIFSKPLETETEVSETDVAFTEDDDDDDTGSAHVPTDEASSTEEYQDDDDQVYSSFKESVRMLRAVESRSRSTSPAISMRSVITDLEEDEEDLPPDEVDDEVESTTEEDEEDDTTTAATSTTSSSSHSSRVPKSPVKVRVKVEKSALYDDQVKVTVQLEESESEEETEGDEEDEDDDISEGTTTTAETVRHRRTDGESYEEGEESTEPEEDDSESESDSVSEEEETDSQKTDQRILTSRFKDGRNVSSLGDLPLPNPRIPQSVKSRSQTVHEIDNEIIRKKAAPPVQPESSSKSSSSPSETSSRSQSARSSLVGKVSSVHKMYSVGGKLRSLSARRSLAVAPSPHPPPVQIQLSVESPTPPDAASFKASSSTESSETSTRNHSADSHSLTKSNLAIPGKMPLIVKNKSLSARSDRSRQFSAALKQLSLENFKTLREQSQLPPIIAGPSSESLDSKRKFSKPYPLLRNLTYIISSNPTTESDELATQAWTNTTSGATAEGASSSRTSSASSLQRLFSTNTSTSTTQFSERTVSTASSRTKSLWTSTAQSSSQHSLSDLVSTSRKVPGQVSFASAVVEHSLSSHRTKSTSETTNTSRMSSRSGSARSTASASSSSSSGSGSKSGRRKKKRPTVDAINKQFMTYEDILQDSHEDSDDNQLRLFALSRIRKQMMKERRATSALSTDQEDEGEEEEEEEEDQEDSSEESEDDEEEEEDVSDAEKPGESKHIQEPSEVVEEPKPEEKAVGDVVPDPAATAATQPEESDKLNAQSSEEKDAVDKSEDSWSWKDERARTFEYGDSPTGSRIPSAESGYRALPPSPASSVGPSSRQISIESQDLEREKEELLSQWRKGEKKPAIELTKEAGPVKFDFNFTIPGRTQDPVSLIQGDIDLTSELPKDEKHIANVWDEFNRDERSAAALADYEFSNLLDEMVTDVNNYKPRHSNSTGVNSQNSQSLQVSNQVTSSSNSAPKFDASRKYTTLAELVALLSHNLRLVSAETLEDHMASLISLTSTILKKVRKNKTEDDYNAQIACLSAIRVLCDRLQEMHNSQNLKYADLSWLFRILCRYSSDADSKIRPEASFCLARLVKVAGPALVVRPIYFILVMESEGGGSGKTTTGAKTKAAAIDTLTYALLTFPKDDFHNLEEIAGWVCLSMLNEERRIRQSALECLAVIAQHLGGRDTALPLFRTLFLKEELDHFSRSPSPESTHTAKTGKSRKSGKTGGGEGAPTSLHGTVRLLTGPGFPVALPIDAITARIDKDCLPVPSTKGLIEYAVNIPTGKDLVLLMTHMLDKADDEFDFSSSTDSCDSGSVKVSSSKRSSVTSLGFSDIDWTGEGTKEKKTNENELISADVAYILLGRGRVNKSEILLLDIYKRELIPELIEMFNRRNKGQGRNRRRGRGKGVQVKRKRRRRNRKRKGILDEDGNVKPPIPTLSFDLDDEERQRREDGEDEGRQLPRDDDDDGVDRSNVETHVEEDDHSEVEDEVFKQEKVPVKVVIDKPTDPPRKIPANIGSSTVPKLGGTSPKRGGKK